MPCSAEYAEAVKNTFRLRALRTVLIIDDQFPTYNDLIELSEDELERFKEPGQAKALYSLFRSNNMPCDIENDAREIRIDRIRKSDLIVLDYHLTPDSEDSSQSTNILRELAATEHFNTVILYTRAPDLGAVWADLLLGLRRGWIPPTELLEGAALETWERLADEEKLPEEDPAIELILAHARGGRILWPEEHVAPLRAVLIAAGFAGTDVDVAITALIHRAVQRQLKHDKDALGGPPQPVVGNYESDGPKWLHSRNCFVVVLGKKGGDGDDTHPAAVDRLLDCLDEAFVAWQPNILQVLISEIQNILELDALATAQDEFRDSATQVGLAYYVLDAVKEANGPEAPEHFKAPLSALIDKLVETLRHRIGADSALGTLASTLLTEELTEQGWLPGAPEANRVPSEVFRVAERIARPSGDKPTPSVALFALNSFLSTEPFRRDHLTTGTIFRTPTDEYWVCASPACDLVPRIPGRDQHWPLAIHPLRPMIAARLRREDNHERILKEAHNGRHVFLRGAESLGFAVGYGSGYQPSFEMFFVENATRIYTDAAGRTLFKGSRVVLGAQAAEGESHFEAGEYVVIGQLRPTYATKVLQMVGQHLSRIGLDFVRIPTP